MSEMESEEMSFEEMEYEVPKNQREETKETKELTLLIEKSLFRSILNSETETNTPEEDIFLPREIWRHIIPFKWNPYAFYAICLGVSRGVAQFIRGCMDLEKKFIWHNLRKRNFTQFIYYESCSIFDVETETEIIQTPGNLKMKYYGVSLLPKMSMINQLIYNKSFPRGLEDKKNPFGKTTMSLGDTDISRNANCVIIEGAGKNFPEIEGSRTFQARIVELRYDWKVIDLLRELDFPNLRNIKIFLTGSHIFPETNEYVYLLSAFPGVHIEFYFLHYATGKCVLVHNRTA